MGCRKGGRRNSAEVNAGGSAASGRTRRASRSSGTTSKPGRPPTSSSTAHTRCRFLPDEVAEMEKLLELNNGLTPSRSVYEPLAEKFSNSLARRGQAPVRPKQVWTWFQNRRYKISRMDKNDGPSSSGRNANENSSTAEQLLVRRVKNMQFEAISSRDGAWYDVKSFLGYRISERGEAEVRVKYAGEEDEWINLKQVRRRSLPCEGFECMAIYPGDQVLCFQEGDEHALYYDAKVVDVHRKRHDARGCRCRFWIRYDHDQFEEVVPLRKVCRRPETDARLKKHYNNNTTTNDIAQVLLEQQQVKRLSSKKRRQDDSDNDDDEKDKDDEEEGDDGNDNNIDKNNNNNHNKDKKINNSSSSSKNRSRKAKKNMGNKNKSNRRSRSRKSKRSKSSSENEDRNSDNLNAGGLRIDLNSAPPPEEPGEGATRGGSPCSTMSSMESEMSTGSRRLFLRAEAIR